MMDKRSMQFPKYSFPQYAKNSAVTVMEEYINAHISDFKDGEEIAVKYSDGNIVNATVVIKANGVAELSVPLYAQDTLRIVESESEPEDKNTLWVSDEGEDVDLDDIVQKATLKEEVRELRRANKELLERLQRLEYILTGEYSKDSQGNKTYVGGGVIAGGDMLTNSIKYELENREEETERPDGAPRYGSPVLDSLIVDFEIYLGNTSLAEYAGGKAPLYRYQKYFLKAKYFNAAGHEVTVSNAEDTTTEFSVNSTYVSLQKNVMISSSSGFTTVTGIFTKADGTTIEKVYDGITFDSNEKPSYQIFKEPNVKHNLVKTVETYDLLTANTSYLCVNELVWCKEKTTMYFKGEDSEGNINLYAISGGEATTGGEDPIPPETGNTSGDTTGTTTGNTSGTTTGTTTGNTTGTTTGTTTGSTIEDNVNYLYTTYKVNGNSELEITSDDGTTYVEDDILHLKANVTENGVLELDDRKTQECSVDTIFEVGNDGTLNITSNDNNVTVEDDILNINAKVENDILYLEDKHTIVGGKGTLYNVSDNGVLDITSNDNSSRVEDDILNIVGNVDENGVLILNDKVIKDNSSTSTIYEVDENGNLTITSTDGNVSVDGDILNINADVDENGVINLNNTYSDAKTVYEIDENGIINIVSNDGTTSVDNNGILNLKGDVDKDGILTLNDRQSNKKKLSFTIDENGILTITSNDGKTNVDENGILTLNGIVDEEGILNLKDIADISKLVSIDEDGILNVTIDGIAIDEDGYLIIDEDIINNEILNVDGVDSQTFIDALYDVLMVNSIDDDGYLHLNGEIEDGILTL